MAVEPSLVILDEATAGLDPETEKQVAAVSQAKLAGGIIISHKIEPIKLCDEIIVFEEGRVFKDASQQLLKEEEGLYQLFTLESKE